MWSCKEQKRTGTKSKMANPESRIKTKLKTIAADLNFYVFSFPALSIRNPYFAL
jgi:hypothetical protein